MKESKEFNQFGEKLMQRVHEIMDEFELSKANKNGLAIFNKEERLKYVSEALKNEDINLDDDTLKIFIETIDEISNNEREQSQ